MCRDETPHTCVYWWKTRGPRKTSNMLAFLWLLSFHAKIHSLQQQSLESGISYGLVHQVTPLDQIRLLTKRNSKTFLFFLHADSLKDTFLSLTQSARVNCKPRVFYSPEADWPALINRGDDVPVVQPNKVFGSTPLGGYKSKNHRKLKCWKLRKVFGLWLSGWESLDSTWVPERNGQIQVVIQVVCWQLVL